MIITALDIIKDAMKEIGALAIDETPSSSAANDSFRALNSMIDSWSARKLLSSAGIRQSFSLVYNQYSYTIGIGGNFNTSVPISISDAFIRDGNNVDSSLEIVTMDLYNSYGDKSFSPARPTTIAFDAGATQQASPKATIYVYPVPDSSTPYLLFITQQKMLTEFTNFTDLITFPSSYYRALKFNLAIEIYGSYFNESKQPIPIGTVNLAKESMRIIETVNARRVSASMDLPGIRQGVFNIYTGDTI